MSNTYEILTINTGEDYTDLELSEHGCLFDLSIEQFNPESTSVSESESSLTINNLKPMELVKACWYMITCASYYHDESEILEYIKANPVGIADNDRETEIKGNI
jgi:hypothetical protein